MKPIAKLFSVLIGMVFFVIPVGAQPIDGYEELDFFQSKSRYLSTLFRGKQATQYRIPANGHVYWTSPLFLVGDIVFEGRLYKDISLNIDSVAQEILVLGPGSGIPIALPAEDVSRFTMEQRNFINARECGLDLPEITYEVLHSGTVSLYKNVRKELRFSSSNVNGRAIGYEDPSYKFERHNYYEYIPTYYLVEDGASPVRVKKVSALRRYLKKYKKEVRSCIAENGGSLFVYSGLDNFGPVVLDYLGL